MSPFKSALEAAFGTGTAELPELKIDQLDGPSVAGQPAPLCATCACLAEPVPASYCRAETPGPVLATLCQAEPVRTCYCRAESPEPVTAIAG
ncbi:hypothetical protein AB0F52_33385 [Amycolatopsis sp. NPDC024027]|uniref:hypothetical protein n=1 Tax=Amycolatopsis sp. NPDC024027 TaxID=3154327 RepID=UPI0033C2DD72